MYIIMNIVLMVSLLIFQVLFPVVISEGSISRSMYNVALDKPTNQSSLSSTTGGSSWKAVDGVLDADLPNESCAFPTDQYEKPWWQVDLGRMYQVTRVSILSTWEYFPFNFTIEVAGDIEVFTNVSDSQLCQKHEINPFGAWSLQTFPCPNNTDGRYVRISSGTQRQKLVLCEVIVEVRADQCTNRSLALNKNTFQSSTYHNSMFYAKARLAVDGNLSPDMLGNMSCSQTGSAQYSWWQVDLGKLYHIQQVSVQNRNILGERLSNFTIEVSKTGRTDENGYLIDATLCFYHPYAVLESQLKTLPCLQDVIGRFVRVSKVENSDYQPLCLCEVIVEGGEPSCIDITESTSVANEIWPTTFGSTTLSTVSTAPTTTTRTITTTTPALPMPPTATTNLETHTTEVQPYTRESHKKTMSSKLFKTSSQESTSAPAKVCLCVCQNNTLAMQKYYNRTIESLVEELKQRLLVNKKGTSAHIRKLVSVDDGKTSSRNIGYVAIFILVVVGLVIIAPDIVALVTYIKS